jgi:hypothetical protein
MESIITGAAVKVTAAPLPPLVHGVVVLDGACKVRLLSKPYRIPGGYVVDVERAEDSTDPAQRLRDGSIHPAHRAGFRWTACVCNLRPAIYTGASS